MTLRLRLRPRHQRRPHRPHRAPRATCPPLIGRGIRCGSPVADSRPSRMELSTRSHSHAAHRDRPRHPQPSADQPGSPGSPRTPGEARCPPRSARAWRPTWRTVLPTDPVQVGRRPCVSISSPRRQHPDRYGSTTTPGPPPQASTCARRRRHRGEYRGEQVRRGATGSREPRHSWSPEPDRRRYRGR